VLIVEKETVFYRLLSEGVLERHRPLILVTAKGFPDLPTRYFLRRLREDCRSPTMLVLTDFDPHGLAIAATYAFGPGSGWEHEDVGLPDIVPIAIAPAVAEAEYGLARGETRPLSCRDEAVARGLAQRFARRRAEGASEQASLLWEAAAERLLQDGVKYELDALEGLSELVARAIRAGGSPPARMTRRRDMLAAGQF